MKNIFLSTVIICLTLSALCSCSTNSASKSSDTYILDYHSLLEVNESEANLSQYVSDIEYIPIETNSDVLISNVRTIATSDNYIYVLCTSTQNLYQFGPDGKFVKKIGVRGRAKNEYMAVRSLYAENGSVTLEFGRKIITYNAQSGEVVSVYEPSDLKLNSFGSVQFLNDGAVAIMNTTNNSNMVYIFDNEMKIKDSVEVLSPVKKKIQTSVAPQKIVAMNNPGKEIKQNIVLAIDWEYNSNILVHNGQLRVSSPFMDTIWTYTDEKLVPYVILNYGSISNEQRFEPVLKGNLSVNALSVKETDNMLLFQNWSEEKCIFNKSTGLAVNLGKGFVNDVDGTGEPFWPTQIQGNKMYQVVSSDLFIEAAEKSNSQKMKDVANSITEESNPVIVVATLKQ